MAAENETIEEFVNETVEEYINETVNETNPALNETCIDGESICQVTGTTTTTTTMPTTTTTIPVNQPPVAVIIAFPTSGSAPMNVTLFGNASYDPDGSINSYFWIFGDGGWDNFMNGYHWYNSPGSYTINLTVYDNQGLSDSDLQLITLS